MSNANLIKRVEKLESVSATAAALWKEYLKAVEHTQDYGIRAREMRRIHEKGKYLMESGQTDLAQFVETSELLARVYEMK